MQLKFRGVAVANPGRFRLLAGTVPPVCQKKNPRRPENLRGLGMAGGDGGDLNPRPTDNERHESGIKSTYWPALLRQCLRKPSTPFLFVEAEQAIYFACVPAESWILGCPSRMVFAVDSLVCFSHDDLRNPGNYQTNSARIANLALSSSNDT